MDRSHIHLFVATDGSDTNPGTEAQPFASLQRAREAIRALPQRGKKPITVLVREGTYYLREPYYLPEPLVFGPQDSGSPGAPITYAASVHGSVTISGGRRLTCRWKPFRDGIMMCELPEVKSGELGFTQLFVGGKRQIMARYPNYDASEPGVSGYVHAAGPLPDVLVRRLWSRPGWARSAPFGPTCACQPPVKPA